MILIQLSIEFQPEKPMSLKEQMSHALSEISSIGKYYFQEAKVKVIHAEETSDSVPISKPEPEPVTEPLPITTPF